MRVGCQQQVPDLVSDGSTEQRGTVDLEMTGKVEDAIDVDRGQHTGAFLRVYQGVAEATRVSFHPRVRAPVAPAARSETAACCTRPVRTLSRRRRLMLRRRWPLPR